MNTLPKEIKKEFDTKFRHHYECRLENDAATDVVCDCEMLEIKQFLADKLAQHSQKKVEEEKKKRHNWVIKKGLSKYAYCEKCAYMMKYRDNDWDCPGMAKLTLRKSIKPTHKEK